MLDSTMNSTVGFLNKDPAVAVAPMTVDTILNGSSGSSAGRGCDVGADDRDESSTARFFCFVPARLSLAIGAEPG